MSRPLSGRGRRSPLREICIMGLAVVVGGVLVTGYATFRIWQQGTTDDTRPVDAIVVLGAAQYDGTPSPVFAARLDHAVHLFAAGVAPVLVVTGGRREGDRTTEAASAPAYPLARGLPDYTSLW
ncbi:MAG: YdcF family protein, partial [Candidatus Limnocylindrales bacterium]|nr:YdcF family protein [Candidatus Limnocylindrales bacterium]